MRLFLHALFLLTLVSWSQQQNSLLESIGLDGLVNDGLLDVNLEDNILSNVVELEQLPGDNTNRNGFYRLIKVDNVANLTLEQLNSINRQYGIIYGVTKTGDGHIKEIIFNTANFPNGFLNDLRDFRTIDCLIDENANSIANAPLINIDVDLNLLSSIIRRSVCAPAVASVPVTSAPVIAEPAPVTTTPVPLNTEAPVPLTTLAPTTLAPVHNTPTFAPVFQTPITPAPLPETTLPVIATTSKPVEISTPASKQEEEKAPCGPQQLVPPVYPYLVPYPYQPYPVQCFDAQNKKFNPQRCTYV